jgi:hypothetical protein
MEVLESVTVTALDQLENLYARSSERVLRKEIDHVDAAGARSSPPHHFSCWPQEAVKGSTAHPKATSRASSRLRMTGAHC